MVPSELSAELIRRQLPCGGWSALVSSAQPALEPTCYSLLAIGSQATDSRERAQAFLLRKQNPNGSWPVFVEDDHDGSWLTSLVAITLRDFVAAIPARLKGLHWLLSNAGKEGDWFWRWKFRTSDRHVRFDPDKFGWPWFPDTVSWVVPTTFAILAFNQLPCTCGGFELAPFARKSGSRDAHGSRLSRWRMECGKRRRLRGRRCTAPRRHGNCALGAPLSATRPSCQTSLNYLERTAPTLTAPWSLAWAILALAAHRRPITSVRRALLAFRICSTSKTRTPLRWSASRSTTNRHWPTLE